MSWAACWSMVEQAIAAWASRQRSPSEIAGYSFRNPDKIRGKRSVCSREMPRRRLDGAGIGIWSDQSEGIGSKLTYRLVGKGRFQASGPSLILRK